MGLPLGESHARPHLPTVNGNVAVGLPREIGIGGVMFGFLKDVAEIAGEAVGTVAGVAVAPIAVALGVSKAAVRAAVKAGCETKEEIQEWIEANWDE